MFNKKALFTAFILGLLVAITVYHVYVVYTLREEVASHKATINQIVSFLNANTAPATK